MRILCLACYAAPHEHIACPGMYSPGHAAPHSMLLPRVCCSPLACCSTWAWCCPLGILLSCLCCSPITIRKIWGTAGKSLKWGKYARIYCISCSTKLRWLLRKERVNPGLKRLYHPPLFNISLYHISLFNAPRLAGHSALLRMMLSHGQSAKAKKYKFYLSTHGSLFRHIGIFSNGGVSTSGS